MNARVLLERCRVSGLSVHTEGEELVVRGRPDPELLAALKKDKTAVLAYLADVDSRRAWSVELCRRLSAGIAYQCPAGLGRWSYAWEIVAEPSNAFLEALARWEESGSEADRKAAEVAAGEVAIAWERAALEWRGQKRPA